MLRFSEKSSTPSDALPNSLSILSIPSAAADAVSAALGFAMAAMRRCPNSALHGAIDVVFRGPIPVASAFRHPRTWNT
jgi:hypothetical protein